jgi:hypothetical protein
MHCIIGPVSQVKNEWTWAGEGAAFWATTLFTIDEQKVLLHTASRPTIENHDRIAVAGEVRRDKFTALAYRNLSKGSSGNSGFGVCLITGLLFIFAALDSFLTTLFGSMLFAAVGAFHIRRAVRIGEAIYAVKSAT